MIGGGNAANRSGALYGIHEKGQPR